MRKVIFAINVTIDGYADHTSGIVDDELLDFFSDLLDETDIELFGRVTYQLMESAWPHMHEDPKASRGELDFAKRFNAIPKIVFSKTLQTAEWNNTKLNKGDVVEEVKKLKTLPGKNISVGSLSLAAALMKQRLIDEYWFLIHPIVAGNGRRLFEGFENSKQLELLETQKLSSGVVVLHYKSLN